MESRNFKSLKKYFPVCFLVTILGYSLIEPQTLPGKDFRVERGIKYTRNYSRKDYDNQPQNWAVLQDKRGVIYVANHGGLMEFDGVSWREIIIPNRTVRSLAIDDKGIIYVGGINEIGFLAPGSRGSIKYISLMPRLDKKYRNFSSVWRTHATTQGIYFCTSKFLLHWDFKKITCKARTDNSFAAPFLCKGKLYVRENGVGLQEMKKDGLELIPGGEAFSSKSIPVMVEYINGKLLIGTGSGSFYLYDYHKGNITPVETFAADTLDYLKNNKLRYGIRLSPGDIALATIKGGVVIIDPRGKVKNVFNRDLGLQDDEVNYIFEDFQGNLWLCLGEGISKIEYASPFSFYEDTYGLPGNVLAVVRHRGHLYAGTHKGLYFLDSSASSLSPGKFRTVTGIPGYCYSLLAAGDSLLAATHKGVFQVKNDKIKNIIYSLSFTLYRSREDKNRIWVGTNQGLVSLYFHWRNGQWTEEYKFENVNQEIITIVEDKKGNLWLGARTNGVLKIDFPSPGKITPRQVSAYDSSHGLPTGEVYVFMAAGHVMFATARGIFRFNEEKEVFFPDNTFGPELAGGKNKRDVFRIVEDKNKNIWINYRIRNIQAIPQSNGTFALNKKPFLRIPGALVSTIYPDPDEEIAWFAGVDGLIGYNTNLQKNYRLPFQTLIREVVVNRTPLFYDAEVFKYKERKGDYWKDNFPVFPYKDRDLCFQFAAPFFEGESETRYQYLLEGYDHDWSAWTKDTRKDYTNLDPGLHTFRVRAKNVYGNMGKETAFQFKVLPPWYLTWWAFSVYALAFFFTVFFIVKWRSRKLVRDKKQLEQIVKNRTAEVYEKNLLLEEQSGKLKEMDKVKSRFFANISHEFRTPLTLIMGPLEQLLSNNRDKKEAEAINMALRNSRRLLSLINQLLDLSKLDGGKLRLRASRQNIIPFLKGLVGSFESLALEEKLELSFHTDEEDISLYFDAEKLEKMIINLVSNAVKFTPAGGKIVVHAAGSKNYIEITVRDTGIGIPGNQLPYIFDRFYQAGGSISHGPKQKGTGIGLALVKELVALQGGEIDVQSQEGKGTEFFVRLPLGSGHLKPGEIAAKTPGVPEYTSVEKWRVEDKAGDEDRLEDEREVAGADEERNIILVVEDNADVRRYVRGPLEALYTVKEAVDGKQGIDKAKKIIPDLIVSDIMMPGIDGYELCKTLKTHVATSHIPIILLTAKASDESVIQGLETGADDYITKPFNIKILLTRIKNLIDLRRHLQEKTRKEMVLQPTEIAVSSIDQEFTRELKAAVEKNMSDMEFGVDELAKVLYMSRATLNRKIRALTGASTNQFIQSYRLKRAAQLLKTNFGNVTEVAFEVGFSSSPYFSKCFKEKFHQLPHDFQVSGAHQGNSSH